MCVFFSLEWLLMLSHREKALHEQKLFFAQEVNKDAKRYSTQQNALIKFNYSKRERELSLQGCADSVKTGQMR